MNESVEKNLSIREIKLLSLLAPGMELKTLGFGENARSAVDLLIKKNFIEYRNDPDLKHKYIYLTKKGKLLHAFLK